MVIPEWFKWSFDGTLGAAALTAAVAVFQRLTRRTEAPRESLEEVSPGIRDLQESRRSLPANKGKGPQPPKCSMKVTTFVASLNSNAPSIQVNVDITNFEAEPLKLFVISVDYLHLNRGQPLYHIENFIGIDIPATQTKQLFVQRSLASHEAVALGLIPDRPTASATASVVALINFKGRDYLPGNSGLQVDGRIEGEPPYTVLTPLQWDLVRQRLIPAVPLGRGEKAVLLYLRPTLSSVRECPAETIAEALSCDQHGIQEGLELLLLRGLVYKKAIRERTTYVLSAEGLEVTSRLRAEEDQRNSS
jgi:hypothetical protein